MRERFTQHPELKRRFFEVRDDINNVVGSCASNVRVVVYIDGVLDDPIVVKFGKEKNRLVITIATNGNVKYQWTKETWKKAFRDGWAKVVSITKQIVAAVASKARTLCLTAAKYLPLTF